MPSHRTKSGRTRVWVPFKVNTGGQGLASTTKISSTPISLYEAELGADVGAHTIMRFIVDGYIVNDAVAPSYSLVRVAAFVESQESGVVPGTEQNVDWLFNHAFYAIRPVGDIHVTEVHIDNRSSRMVETMGQRLILIVDNLGPDPINFGLAGRYLILV